MAENLKAILGACLANSEDLTTALTASNKVLDLCTANGVNLDLCGTFLGEERFTYTDIEYRARLKKKAEILKGYGSRNQVIEVIKHLTGATSVVINEPAPATMSIEIVTPIDLTLINNIKHYVAGGVSLLGIRVSAKPFVFEGETGGGFGDVNDPLVGGDFSYYIIF